jgi:hypothetical protein
MSYTFLTKNFEENGITKYYAIPSDKIETISLHETYDQYGQTIGHTNAGDYSIENEYCEAESLCITDLCEKFNIENDNINAIHPDGDIELEDQVENLDIEAVKNFILIWEKENCTYTTVNGFNYWDGHNNKTITTECNTGEASHSVITDEKLIRSLNYAINNMKFDHEGFGTKIYKTTKFVIEDSCVQGIWESYCIIPIEEYDFAF